MLSRVHRGELPFDRTVQVSVTDKLEKEQILGRLPHNLRTLEVLIKQNKADYRIALSKKRKMAERARPGRGSAIGGGGACGSSRSSVSARSGSRR